MMNLWEKYNMSQCENCVNYYFDDELEEYCCDINLDEDEMMHFLTGSFGNCPYYRDNDELEKIIIPVDKILMSYPSVSVSKAQGVRFKNGGELLKQRIKGEVPLGLIRVYCENEFLGLGESLENSESLNVKRVYVER